MGITEYDQEYIRFAKGNKEVLPVFAVVKALMSPYLPEVVIEHVGSTAVPGLENLNVIDLLLISSRSSTQYISDVMENIGYQKNANDHHDYFTPDYVGAITYKGQIFNLHIFISAKEEYLPDQMLKVKEKLLHSDKLKHLFNEFTSEAKRSGRTDLLFYNKKIRKFLNRKLQVNIPKAY